MPVLWTARFQGAGFSFGPPEFWKAGLFAWTVRWMVRKRRAKSSKAGARKAGARKRSRLFLNPLRCRRVFCSGIYSVDYSVK